MSSEVKLRREDGATMTVRESDAERIICGPGGWSPEAIRTRIETDSEAKRACQNETVYVATGNVFLPILELKAGTAFKEAGRLLREYRRENEKYGRLMFSTDWR